MTVEFPSMRRAGDRVGVCLSSLDAKLLERGVLTTPGSLRPLTTAVALVRKVSLYKSVYSSARKTCSLLIVSHI